MKQRLSLLSTQSRVFIALAIVLVGVISGAISVNNYLHAHASTANGVQINAGGPAVGSFVADEDFNGAHVCGGTNAAINTTGVSDPAPQGVYQTNRCGNFIYSIPNLTASASYTVRLHFAETYWKGQGKRIFNVKLNGQQVLTNFDIFATAGAADKAIVEQFTTTANASGTITIQFVTVQDNALVSGIEVLGGSTIQNGTQGSGSELAIDAGGPAAGTFVADEDFTGARACGGTNAAIDTSDVTDAAPQAVYQTSRCGNFTYTIPHLTTNANYTVRLHFAETYWNAAGKRIFNVKLNGQQVLTNFDIFATAGAAKKAVAEQFTTTANASGTITIQFITVQDNALVSGIEIIGGNAGVNAGGGSTPTPNTQSVSISLQNEIAWPVFDGGGQHSGVNPAETTITTNNVGNLTQLWQQTLPGTADGAPVELPHVTTPLGIKDLLFVTTKAGSLIAIDAATGAQVWRDNTSGPYFTTSSPAIDPSGQFVYSYGLDGYVHKYKVGDGTEITNATWPAQVTKLLDSEKGEPPITIANGYLYMTTAGHFGDGGSYQGHIIAVNLATGVETVFNALCANIQHLLASNECSDSHAGIWGRGAPEVDPVTGNLYVTTGNGPFDVSKHDYGDSVLELSPDLTKLLDSYTPTKFQTLQGLDQDLGSASPAILPKQANSSTPYMMVQAGKDQTLRLINRQNLSGQGGPNHVGGEVQALALPQGGDVDTQPAVWTDASGTTWVFVANFNGFSAFKVATDAQGHSTLQLAYKSGSAGSSPFIANNILFLQGSNVLRAINPTTGAVLWSSTQPSAGGSIGSLHWQSPIVVNGHLFAEDNNGKIYAYGLKSTLTPAPMPAPTPTPIPTKPVASPSPVIGAVQIKIIDDSTNPSGFSFSPATVTITKGTKVTWVNDSAAPHTVTPDNTNAFTASPTLETNQSYSLVFNTAGTYTYHCVVHPQMKATIIVTG